MHNLNVLEDWIVGVSLDDLGVSVHLRVHLILEHVVGAPQELHLDLDLRDDCWVDQRGNHETRDGRYLDIDSLACFLAFETVAGCCVLATAEKVAHRSEVVVVRLRVQRNQLHTEFQSR